MGWTGCSCKHFLPDTTLVSLVVRMKILWDDHGAHWYGRLYRLTRSLLPAPIVPIKACHEESDQLLRDQL